MSIAHVSLRPTEKPTPKHPDYRGSGTWGPKLETHWVALWVNTDGYRVSFSDESREGWSVQLDADGVGLTRAYEGIWTVFFDAEHEHLTLEREAA